MRSWFHSPFLLIPALLAERHAVRAFFAVVGQQPAAPRLVVNARRPHPSARHIHVNLALVAVDAIRRRT